jgi:SAM-dependent methyltransferase
VSEKPFGNVYDDEERARAYAGLTYPGTYALAFRDLPAIIGERARGARALDFGCGAGRSTRFLRSLSLDVVGVDISRPMLEQARALDPGGTYRLVTQDGPERIAGGPFELILAAFTFDNIPGDDGKLTALGSLGRLTSPQGRLILIVSAPEIYCHEWVSFSTRDFPGNQDARDGDTVRVVMLDVPDRRPVEDELCSDARYCKLFARAGLAVLETRRPLATGEEPVAWVNETRIAPWTIYVLGALGGR